MIVAYVIHKGNFPSISHARFLDEEECKIEVARLEKCRIESNNEPRVRGHGSVFWNLKDNEVWSYKRMEFPK